MTVTIDESTVLASEVAVLRALEMAGKRCRNVSRDRRKVLIAETPDHLLYTQLPNASRHEDCDRLLEGAWDHLRLVLPGRPKVYALCDWYVRELLVTRQQLTRADLERVLAVAHE